MKLYLSCMVSMAGLHCLGASCAAQILRQALFVVYTALCALRWTCSIMFDGLSFLLYGSRAHCLRLEGAKS